MKIQSSFQIEEHLNLKQIELQDAAAIFNIICQQRDYLGRWLPFAYSTLQVSDSECFIQSLADKPLEQVFTIRYDDELIGLISFHHVDYANLRLEIGYWISQFHQGKGIVTKALARLLNYAFFDLHIHRVTIKCAAGNLPSKGIPRRLGFQLEGIERESLLLSTGEFSDFEVYSLLSQDWIPHHMQDEVNYG
ncbi:GNAT family protein [Pasteurellaceae bacterium LIM206]|nr:GNAT family protein [Pasteurellaceae bacterium LIM206]